MLRGRLGLLVRRHHLLVVGRALLALLLAHVVVHEVVLGRGGLVVVVRMLVLVVRLHVVLRGSLLVVRMRLLLRVVVVLMVVVIERCLWRTFQWRTSGSERTRADGSGLELTARVQGCLMSVRRPAPSQMSHSSVIRRVRSVTPTTCRTVTIRHDPAVALLLGPVVGRVPNIHAVVGWKSGVRHALRRLPRGGGSSIVVRRDTLSEAYDGVVAAGARTRVGGNGATLAAPLRHHRGPIVVVLVRVLRGDHAAVTQVRDVRVEVGTHDVIHPHTRHRRLSHRLPHLCGLRGEENTKTHTTPSPKNIFIKIFRKHSKAQNFSLPLDRTKHTYLSLFIPL